MLSPELNRTILIMEDDENDAMLLKRALQKNQIPNPVQHLTDGAQGIEYLTGQGKYADRDLYPFPSAIILDLKMPRVSGHEVLTFLQKSPEHRTIPILVLTSSSHDSDIFRAYAEGATTYFVKPGNFDDLKTLVQIINQYWARAKAPLRKRVRAGL